MKNLALIIETRPLKNLVQIIENHMKFLPENFEALCLCSNDNAYILFEAKINYEVITNNKDIDWSYYNRILTDKQFWFKFLGYNRVLVFQHDSEILRKGINEFYKFDYTGAPWLFQKHGGNGGLSLRNPRVMYEISKETPYAGMQVDGNEDIYFSNKMKDKYNLAPREVCEKFSAESIFKMGTLGTHAIDRYLTVEECKKIRSQYV